MQATAPLRQTELHHRRIRLASDPRAVAEARKQACVTIAVWDVPVDTETASLLVSELVTNAVTHDGVGAVTMAIRVARGRFRVDVHDTSSEMPDPELDTPVDAESGRGLLLVDTLADEWGFYPTPGGKAVYFSLALRH
ncbi:MAG: ATP-binding protein [Streptosporangiales bacterium]|nr:ATP-binding protein [Streptosporangiales bacterium]